MIMAKMIYLLWDPYLKLLYNPETYTEKVECFTSKPNAHGTFWHLFIKIHISQSSGRIKLKFCTPAIF